MADEKRLIDANDALKRLRKVEPKLHVVDYLGFKAVDIDAFIRFLESQKTVDAVEVVHGRWVAGMGSYSTSNCSVCNWKIPYCEDYYGYLGETNYCPNCGAKMDGDGNA